MAAVWKFVFVTPLLTMALVDGPGLKMIEIFSLIAMSLEYPHQPREVRSTSLHESPSLLCHFSSMPKRFEWFSPTRALQHTGRTDSTPAKTN